MNTRTDRLLSRNTPARRRRFGALLAGVIVVPLLVAGVFAGAFGNADERVGAIPAIVVNNDAMVTTTGPDGSKQMILAGRQLVTELTGGSATGFDWTISNSAKAREALADGTANAVLTIPRDFSKSIQSLQGASPTQADLSIRTDDAHDYLAGSVAQSVGQAMTSAFGTQITTRYLTAFYENLAGMGGSLSTAATGATKVSDGTSSVASGLDSLAQGASSAASGANSAASGAASLSAGVNGYTGGVDQLADGLARLRNGSAGLSSLSTGVSGYTGTVGTLSAQLSDLNSQVQSDPLVDPTTKSRLQQLAAGLAQTAAAGTTLASQTSTAVSGVQGGIASSADGAARLSAGSAQLRSGAGDLASGVRALADGVGNLASGTSSAASGAHELAAGASQLATGLSSGAKQASALKGASPTATAKVVADPVGVSVTRANAISGIGSVIGIIFVPIGLWIGALAVLLLLRPLTPVLLASTASTGRLVLRGLGRAAAVGVAQAVVLVALLHAALGVSWQLLPATLGFAVLLALVFAAVHHLLGVVFGRAGAVVSILLLAVQLPVLGGLFPSAIVSAPFRAIAQFLPLTYAVQGMQGIVAGASGSVVGGCAVALALVGLVCAGLSFLLVGRRRRARSLAFATSPA